MRWDRIRYFKPAEFDSPDRPGSGAENMQMEFVRLLDEVRHTVGFPLRVNSGFRTAFHNSTLPNAKPDSAHVRGWAADIKCTTSRHRFAIVMAAMAVGIQRVGVSRSFIHLDCDPGKPPRMCWLY